MYVAVVGVGSPATNYDLIVDTGSSNTWVGASKSYTPTSTSQQTSDSVSVTESGSTGFSGTEYTDQVTLASGLVVSGQSIGVASTAKGFKDVDGILGLGPVDLTVGTLSPDTSSAIPTVVDNLFSQGSIPGHECSVYFEPITDSSGIQQNGQITFGGTDSSKFTGEITYAPITTTSPASNYWGVDASFSYGSGSDSTTILSATAGIVDSGTTLLPLATDAFNSFQKATGGVKDSATGLLSITSQQFGNMKSLYVTISDTVFELTPNALIWPRSLNSIIGGTAGSIYLIVTDNGSNSGSGLDFILGQKFMERFYTVFDTANQRVGFATTPFTDATSN
ncbi:hypothetical protein MVEG_11043 [Podila verticillata NRRL 6337]|uniref:Peptidase A1 domain-containing protein n=1 Tax=Podila verticillata NRRL 6337 TaxID=1069443 RepID=A0A086TM28_9FUNG|nr:hypothetical protein MVEG_11043 [Podila verticillata NRRL 6337]